MIRTIVAPPQYGTETSHDMNPHKPGTSVLPGIARANLTIYEPGEECSSTLPTIGELLDTCFDLDTGLLSIERYTGLPLLIDPAPLRELPQDARVEPGCRSATRKSQPGRFSSPLGGRVSPSVKASCNASRASSRSRRTATSAR